MPFVVDASVAAAWCLPDEDSALANAALARLEQDVALVPVLFWFEIRNLLIVNERRRRIDAARTDRLIAGLDQLSIRGDDDPDSELVMGLARRHRLTVYDAAYLELARRLALPLATLDRRLVAAAVDEGIRLFEP